MDIKKIVDSLQGCGCGRPHKADIKGVEIGPGLKAGAAGILKKYDFPRRILAVADENTLAAADGILEILRAGGFETEVEMYHDLRVADMGECDRVAGICRDKGIKGIISIGTGSLNDTCRLAALKADTDFCIFATAPSMDGFASGTAPITTGNFKVTHPARQPSFVIADTSILAKAPAVLKSAGFGDMIGKLTGLVDWRVSSLITGEYYCANIAALTEEALRRVISLAPRVTEESEEAAEAIMEALVITGIAMKLGDSVRPASGDEHIISHYWEIKKLENGLISDFHGRKVGVATLICSRIYHYLASFETVDPKPEKLDWDDIYRTYGPNFVGDVKRLNAPTVTTETTPETVRECWPEIRAIVRDTLPSDDDLLAIMRSAGAATSISDIAVSPELGLEGVIYHPYMRHRMTLMRLIPMLGIKVDWKRFIE
ncbi:MAG: iron-containing alcohol dehydrogenase [Clostridiales bacterium]|nr:iron-containing alcohol dehydrogenase [Clostridiales bacterium]